MLDIIIINVFPNNHKVHKTRLIRRLRMLSKEQMDAFRKQLERSHRSPNRMLLIFDYIKTFYPDFNHSGLEKKVVYKNIFPEKTYNSKLLLNSASELNFHLENFLIVNEVEKLPLAKRRDFIDSLLVEENREEFFKSGNGRYKYNVNNLPEDLIIPLQQYFIFFKEYIQVTKGKEIDFNVLRTNQGLAFLLKVDESSELSIENAKDYLEEYIDLARDRESLNINFENQVKEDEEYILRKRLERQIENLNWELKLRDEKISLLEERIVDFKTDKEKIYDLFGSKNNQIKRIFEDDPYLDLTRKVKDLLRKNLIEDAFILLKNQLNDTTSKYNEFLILESRWNNLRTEKMVGNVSSDFYLIQNSKIITGVLYLLDKVN